MELFEYKSGSKTYYFSKLSYFESAMRLLRTGPPTTLMLVQHACIVLEGGKIEKCRYDFSDILSTKFTLFKITAISYNSYSDQEYTITKIEDRNLF